MLTLARAAGMSVLEAAATDGASMPMTAIAGPAHSRSVRPPVPVSCTPSSSPASARNCASVRSSGSAPPEPAEPRVRPGTATSPRSSCRVASIRHSTVSASGTGPPYRPLCTPWLQRAHLHDHAGPAAQRGGQRRGVRGPVRRVGEHHHVGADPVGVGRQELRQRRRADLLLALDEHGDPDREPVAVRPQRRQVHRDARLVVGGAAPVEPPVPFGRLERVAVPVRGVAGRLDVVVRVQQDRGGAGRGGPAAQHRGPAVPGGQHVDLGQAGLAQQGGDLAGAGPQVRGGGRIRRHRRDPHQPLEVGAGGRQDLPHGAR